ncbi:hypothetical protein AZA_09432 [Nitrospirillum viridazoti Y2]|uniref:Uncharacterized protein n=1 Tax=Nitrospirillum amazonense TaxID=28077 RepID=A0A560I857_9PROT|nr:hypothetical protein [Nitrospirillum amazonense]EGY00587.1 hypothetical protein AZA_09432 [Nitrospirillum amazonense Y2]TWB54241.1 hypothetical protein FBZ92_1158 [Nitrospirillum amazonense]
MAYARKHFTGVEPYDPAVSCEIYNIKAYFSGFPFAYYGLLRVQARRDFLLGQTRNGFSLLDQHFKQLGVFLAEAVPGHLTFPLLPGGRRIPVPEVNPNMHMQKPGNRICVEARRNRRACSGVGGPPGSNRDM